MLKNLDQRIYITINKNSNFIFGFIFLFIFFFAVSTISLKLLSIITINLSPVGVTINLPYNILIQCTNKSKQQVTCCNYLDR